MWEPSGWWVAKMILNSGLPGLWVLHRVMYLTLYHRLCNNLAKLLDK